MGVPPYFFEKLFLRNTLATMMIWPCNTNLLLGGSLCLFCLHMVRLKSIQRITLTTKMATPALTKFLTFPCSVCNCTTMAPQFQRQLPEKYHCIFFMKVFMLRSEGEKNVKMKLKSLLLKKESITGNSCGKVKVVYLQRRMHRGCCCGRGRTLAVAFCCHSLLMASWRWKHT